MIDFATCELLWNTQMIVLFNGINGTNSDCLE